MNSNWYIKIDEHGNPVEYPISAENMFYVMNNTHDYTEEQLRAKGFATINNSMMPAPEYEAQIVSEGDRVKRSDGSIEQIWIKTEVSTEEKKNQFILRQRYSELMNSDWTQLPNSPLSDQVKAEWAAYRQALRDMPAKYDWSKVKNYSDIQWPVRPDVAAAARPVSNT
jgi:hypothetical protein